MLSCEQVKELIENAIEGATVQVHDLTGTSDHFGVQVESEAFRGKRLLDQHRMVQTACGEYLTREIHALEIKTIIPD